MQRFLPQPVIEPVALTWQQLVEARACEDTPAIITDEGVWSGRELFRRAAGVADFLDAKGVPTGKPIVAILTVSPNAYALTVGAAATDRGLAPLGPKLTLNELQPCVDSMDCEFIISEPAHLETASLLAKNTDRKLIVLDDEIPESDREILFRVDPKRPAAILHTSGTSGIPKAVPYAQGPLAYRAAVNSMLVELGPGCIYATGSPFHHIAGLGMFFVALASGATLLSFPTFTVEAWKELGIKGVTHALIVPTMVEKLLRENALALPGLRVLQYGASPIHPDTLARAMEALPGVRFVNMFGQTEGSPITCLTGDDHVKIAGGRPDLLLSVGRAAPGVEMYIENPDESGVGEVVARAKHFFKPSEDGWLRTGDLGRLDDEGYLFLLSRKGDKIIRGGENVYPLEVEQVLELYPGLLEVSVFAIPDKTWGEVVAAAVVPSTPGTQLDHDAMRAFAREKLAGFKVPTMWFDVTELPRSPVGKVLRRKLIQQFSSD